MTADLITTIYAEIQQLPPKVKADKETQAILKLLEEMLKKEAKAS